jgi:hypothetical protein
VRARAPAEHVRSLETLIRALVRTVPNVHHVRGTVTGLVANEDGTRIQAAHVQLADAHGAAHEIPVAFFADCTGPACGGRKWLARAHPAWALGDGARDAYDPLGAPARSLCGAERHAENARGQCRTRP